MLVVGTLFVLGKAVSSTAVLLYIQRHVRNTMHNTAEITATGNRLVNGMTPTLDVAVVNFVFTIYLSLLLLSLFLRCATYTQMLSSKRERGGRDIDHDVLMRARLGNYGIVAQREAAREEEEMSIREQGMLRYVMKSGGIVALFHFVGECNNYVEVLV